MLTRSWLTEWVAKKNIRMYNAFSQFEDLVKLLETSADFPKKFENDEGTLKVKISHTVFATSNLYKSLSFKILNVEQVQ